jgi:hypothetical protein
MRAINMIKKGLLKAFFPDTNQTVISHSFPEGIMHGIIKGTRTYDYINSLKLSDEGNNIHADIVFNPDKKGWFKRMFSSSQKTAHDHFEGVISSYKDLDYKSNRNVDIGKLKKAHGFEVYAEIDGNWTQKMTIDKKVVWEYSKFKPLKLRYINNPLPSDSRFRTDLIALLNHDFTKAQEQKDELEDLQRYDKKLRKGTMKNKNK